MVKLFDETKKNIACKKAMLFVITEINPFAVFDLREYSFSD